MVLRGGASRWSIRIISRYILYLPHCWGDAPGLRQHNPACDDQVGGVMVRFV